MGEGRIRREARCKGRKQACDVFSLLFLLLRRKELIEIISLAFVFVTFRSIRLYVCVACLAECVYLFSVKDT